MRVPVTVRLEPETPWCISRHRERNVGETLDEVPGSTLRGALAAAWIRVRGMPDEAFDRVFQSGRNRFPFCYPGTGFPRPAPVTTRTCKSHRGPRPTGHGIVDGALALLGLADRAAPDSCSAEGCHERLVRWGRLVTEENGRVLAPRHELRMHAGIHRATGSVRPGVLYGTTVALPWARVEGSPREWERVVLEGTGFFAPEDLEQLRGVLREIDGTILVGRSCSVGLGVMKVRLEEGDGDRTSGLRRRFEAWIEKAPRRLRENGIPVALVLVSPAILRREGRWSFDPVEFLREPLGLDGGARALVQRVPVFGWDMKEGRPRPTEWAVAAGSVVVGRSRLGQEELLDRVGWLEEEGLGARVEEGFGRVHAWDPLLLGDVQ